ncbi:hypothetical protein EV182_001272, partial [Spiromyces aspiralis]
MKLLVLLVLGVLSCAVRNALAACTAPLTRKEIRSASVEERKAFFNAVQKLQDNGKIQEFATIHNNNSNLIHSNTVFLAFHRWFVKLFENALREVDPNVAMLYWDWTLDSQHPETSVLFTSDYCGGNGQGPDFCVQDGPFANWAMKAMEPHCLKRQFNQGNTIVPFYSYELLTYTFNESPSYANLTRNIEGGCHGYVHIGIGGDMNEMYAANDLFFFLHHAMIDMIYYQWQMVDESRFQDFGGIMADGSVGTLDSPLPVYSDIKVGQILDPRNSDLLCYTYELSGTAKAIHVAETYARNAAAKNNMSAGNQKRGLIDNLVSDIQGIVDDVGNVVTDVVDTVGNITAELLGAAKGIAEALGIDGDIDLSILKPEDLKLRVPPPPSGSWIDMTHMDRHFVNDYHQKVVEAAKKYNDN